MAVSRRHRELRPLRFLFIAAIFAVGFANYGNMLVTAMMAAIQAARQQPPFQVGDFFYWVNQIAEVSIGALGLLQLFFVARGRASISPLITLARQRCFSHEAREAVCKCPSCSRFFCRECVTDFDGRLLCAFCIRDSIAARKQTPGRSRFITAAGSVAAALTAMLLSWAFFYFAGRLLVKLAQAGTQ